MLIQNKFEVLTAISTSLLHIYFFVGIFSQQKQKQNYKYCLIITVTLDKNIGLILNTLEIVLVSLGVA